MLREIKNTYAFGKGYSFCLSKTNLRDEETIRVVRNEISNQLKINFDYDKEIVLLNDNGGENLTRILESIDPEQLFKSIFINELKDQYFSFESRINLAISTLSSTPYEKEKAKCELENTIRDIQREKQKVIDEADFNYSIGYVNEIIRRLNSTLNRNCSLLATYALQNEGTFQNELNSIVRSTILSELKEIVQKISSDCIASMNTKIEAKLPKLSGFNFDKEFVQRLSTSIGNVAMGISQISEQMSKRGNNQLAAAIHLIADVTKIFQPIVGFVIGGVLEAISTIFGSNTIDRKKQDMENALIDQVFPSVQATIREQLNELIPQLRVEAINNISEEYEHKLIQYRQEIEEIIRKEKENKEKNEKIINELKIVKGELNKLAKEVLF
ncbi:hypothetical protein A6A19_03215 [Actinobacillus delphinicola]|uniref:hypothetical protein n=1 Tax=Actinobacillus delphinicola TaxID=51161 RepID=UPI002441E601|nr:hypothetical protein [Actinobacillus delphinicola]MDG6897033.1 hypothetical protein [Actinobacillus delphinicola]